MGRPNDLQGKVILQFSEEGLEKLRNDVAKTEAQLGVSEANLQKIKSDLSKAISTQSESQAKLNVVMSQASKGAVALQQAEDKLILSRDLEKVALDNLLKAQLNLNNVQNDSKKTQEEVQAAVNKVLVAEDKVALAYDRTSQAELNLAKASANQLLLSQQQVTAATKVGVARAQSEIIAAKVAVTEANVSAAQARTTASTKALTEAGDANAKQLLDAYQAKLKASSGLQLLSNAFRNTTSAISNFVKGSSQSSNANNQFNNTLGKNTLSTLTKQLEQATGGLVKFGSTGVNAANAVVNGLSSISPIIGGIIAGIGGIGALAAGLVTAIAAPTAAFVNLAKEVRLFQAATGADAESASFFNVIAKSVGSSAQELSITLGTVQNGIFELNLTAEKAAKAAKQNLDDIKIKLEQLQIDKFKAITDALNDLNRGITDNDRTRDRAQSDFTFNAGQDREDLIAQRTSIQQTVADRIKEINRVLNEKLTDLDRNHGYAVEDINTDIADLQQDTADKRRNIENDLYKALTKLDEDYNSRKLSLAEKYFSSSPLLRPLLKQQLDQLDIQKAAEEQALRDGKDNQISELDRENASRLEKLQERLRREEEAYRISHDRIIEDARRGEEEANTDAARRIAEIERNAQQEIDANQRSLDRQLEDWQLHYDDLRRIADERIAAAYAAFTEGSDKAGRDANENLARAIDASGDTPLGRALKLLKLDPTELVKLPPEEQVFAIAKALNSFTGPEKASIIQQLTGLFGASSIDFFNAVAQAGPSLEEAEASIKKIVPNLILGGDDVKAAFNLEKEIGLIKQFPLDLAVSLGKELLPKVEEVAKGIIAWYSNEENRTKLKNFIDSAATVLNTIMQTILDISTGKTTIRSVILKLFGLDENASNSDLVTQIGKKLGEALSLAIKFINDNISTQDIANLVQTFSNVIAPEALKLGKSFADGFANGLGTAAKDAFGLEKRQAFFQQIDDNFNKNFTISFQNLSDSLNKSWQSISDSLNTAWEGVNTSLVGKLNQLNTTLTNFFNNLAGQLPTINLGNLFNGGTVISFPNVPNVPTTGNGQATIPVVAVPGGTPINNSSGGPRAGSQSFKEGTGSNITIETLNVYGSDAEGQWKDFKKKLESKGLRMVT